MGKSFHIDVNTTKSCNLRCTYCFEVKDEMDKKHIFKEPEALIKFVNKLMDSEWFNLNYIDLSINFWGGEPTLNLELYKHLIIEYLDNKKVRFFLYSNGFNFSDYFIKSFKGLQKLKVNGHPKIVVQVSYDGNPVHDLTRVTPNGKGSSEKVKATIRQLRNNGIFYVVKSTIAPEDFKHLFEAYKDVITISPNYFPTIDMHAEYEGDEYKQYSQDLYVQLIKIAAYEAKRNSNAFRWFNDSKAFCAAGVDMIAIDINGNILPCHGALYTDYNEHLIANIVDDAALKCVIDSSKRFSNFWLNSPRECKNCTNAFCLKCNIAKFQFSKKETYEEKWTDHTSQSYYCHFMDVIGIVSKARKNV